MSVSEVARKAQIPYDSVYRHKVSGHVRYALVQSREVTTRTESVIETPLSRDALAGILLERLQDSQRMRDACLKVLSDPETGEMRIAPFTWDVVVDVRTKRDPETGERSQRVEFRKLSELLAEAEETTGKRLELVEGKMTDVRKLWMEVLTVTSQQVESISRLLGYIKSGSENTFNFFQSPYFQVMVDETTRLLKPHPELMARFLELWERLGGTTGSGTVSGTVSGTTGTESRMALSGDFGEVIDVQEVGKELSSVSRKSDFPQEESIQGNTTEKEDVSLSTRMGRNLERDVTFRNTLGAETTERYGQSVTKGNISARLLRKRKQRREYAARLRAETGGGSVTKRNISLAKLEKLKQTTEKPKKRIGRPIGSLDKKRRKARRPKSETGQTTEGHSKQTTDAHNPPLQSKTTDTTTDTTSVPAKGAARPYSFDD